MKLRKVIFSFLNISLTVLIVLVVLYGAVRVSIISYDFGYRVFTESAMEKAPGRDVVVQVAAGSNERAIAQTLEDQKLVRDHNLFWLQLRLSAYHNKLKSGVYTLNTSMTPKQIMVVLAAEESTTGQSAGEEATENPEAAKETEAAPAEE